MCMITQADKARRFLALHRAGEPLLLPNPWDLGSARLLASFGFEALATTSSGFATTLGRNDGSVSRDEALVHAAVNVAATDLPVSADLENAFADNPEARGYVLDDQSALRKHMAVFVDGKRIRDRVGLSDAVTETSTIHVFQALSGG